MTDQETTKYLSVPNEIIDLGTDGISAAVTTVEDTTGVFDDFLMQFRPVPGRPHELYAPFGPDNQLPYKIRELIGSDEVTAQNKFFNVLACYGGGLSLDVPEAQTALKKEVEKFRRRNALGTFFLEQITDMKYYFMAVCVIILSKDGKRINRLVHKDACFCRLAKADRNGRIRYVYYANWQYTSQPSATDVERIPLLREDDPVGDLMVRMGREPGADGRCRVRTHCRKFAMLLRFPTVGCQYYPTPYYAAMFRGGSYFEKRLISAAKIAKIRNHASVKYQVEVEHKYWQKIVDEERITDPLEIRKRIRREKENIRDFVAGVHNSGKAWITGYYVDPLGHEVRDIRVVNIEGAKEGGDYADDINVAANTLCRRCGITFEGRRVYAEEFSTCFASLMHAHFTASRIVSFEQMQWLLAHQCDTALEKKAVGTNDPRYTLIDLVRTLMAALVMQHKPSERRAMEEVQSFLNRHADALPEYRQSTKYEADQFKPYQNEPHDPCFFFG